MMESVATDCVQLIEAVPQDGTYKGRWGGYVVRFTDANGNNFTAKTVKGIRTINRKVSVIVQGSLITVKTD
jgi:hypothetical protein